MADPGVSADLTPEQPDIIPAGPPQDGTADSSANQEDELEHTDPLVDESESETVNSTQPCQSPHVRKPPNYFSKWEYWAKEVEM